MDGTSPALMITLDLEPVAKAAVGLGWPGAVGE